MSGHFVSDFPDSGSVDYSDQSTNLDETAIAELNELAGRYPHPRSALLPMLHLVQSYDGRISPRGIELCAEILGITTAQVSGVATFYTMFKRRPAGHHHLGVCTTALCAVMGGDILLERAKQRLGIDEGQTTPCGRVSLRWSPRAGPPSRPGRRPNGCSPGSPTGAPTRVPPPGTHPPSAGGSPPRRAGAPPIPTICRPHPRRRRSERPARPGPQ